MLFALLFCAGCGKAPQHTLLTEVDLALQHVPAALWDGPVYANPEGYAALLRHDAKRFGSVVAFAADVRFSEATVDPVLWRKLDREHRFSVILLTGDPAQARALIQHLLKARDWFPVHVDPVALVFARGETSAEKWSPDAFEKLRPSLTSLSSTDYAMALTRTAAKMIAVSEETAASALLEESLALDSRNTETFILLGTLSASREKWGDALNQALKALEIDADSHPALYLHAQSLFALRKFGEASRPADRLLAHAPDDPNYLFLKAKISRELSDYEGEIAALEKIIDALEQRGMSTTFYRIYLAQAFASTGDAPKALEAFEAVQSAPDLTDGQMDFVERAIERLRQGLGVGGA